MPAVVGELLESGWFPLFVFVRKDTHMQTPKNTASKVRDLLEKTVTDLGYDLWDVEFIKEGGDQVLRITIDSEKGISIEDCEKVHRTIDPLLDEADPIQVPYRLEVSSPGIERNLSKPEHFTKCLGGTVEVRLFSAKDGKIAYKGSLVKAEDDSITISENGEDIKFNKSEIAKCKTIFNW